MLTERRRIRWVLFGLFIVITIIGFFYSPWEKDMETAFIQLMHIDNIIDNVLIKLFLYGIVDWVELLAYSLYEMGVVGEQLPGDWGLLTFAIPMLCIFIFIVYQFIMLYIGEEYQDDSDEVLWQCIDGYFIGSIASYIICLIMHCVIHYGISNGIYFLYTEHKLIASICSCVFVILGIWTVISIMPLLFGYVLVISVPLIIWALLSAIPIIGVLINSLLGAVIFLPAEAFMIYYVWPKYISDYVLRAVLWIALAPVNFLKDRI